MPVQQAKSVLLVVNSESSLRLHLHRFWPLASASMAGFNPWPILLSLHLFKNWALTLPNWWHKIKNYTIHECVFGPRCWGFWPSRHPLGVHASYPCWFMSGHPCVQTSLNTPWLRCPFPSARWLLARLDKSATPGSCRKWMSGNQQGGCLDMPVYNLCWLYLFILCRFLSSTRTVKDCLSIYLSIYLFTHPSIHPSIHPSTHPSIIYP